MTRRQEATGDSLELLLDTICNMFGGIVFISLLVAIMLQTSGNDLPSSNEEIIQPADLELLSADLTNSEVTLTRLQEARQRQLELISRYIPADLDDQLVRLKSLNSQRDELAVESGRIEASNLGRITKVNQSKSEIAATERELRSAEQKLSELEEQRRKAAQRHAVKMPHARMLTERLIGIQVCLQYDRLYFRHDLAYLKSGEMRPNHEDYIIFEGDEEIVVHAKRLGGIALDGSVRSQAQIRQKLSQFSNKSYCIAFTVRPDSCDSFRQAQQIISEAGYRYSIFMCTPRTEIVDRGGDNRLTQ